ncbi:pilus assembly protein [Sphingobium lactosutens]|uniref:TadE/TadG family type IV pilus assembly protein n=1 Tax=Sphingobium lactosutens TaxID=522773 RepID=UPI0015B9C05E|nr:TadE/TadG family type IV pilus assembly protein [Sphingobium lactosutens]NWK95316.1 pilus assembly protein [Sphingobium lactosutens]
MTARSPKGEKICSRLQADERGAALIELAFSLPILLVLLMGILAYGNWLYTAQSLQLLANNAARSALAGLSATERRQIAEASVKAALKGVPLDPAKGTVSVTETGQLVQVSISYDVSAEPLLRLPLVPLPGKAITTSATVMLGGL